MEIDQPSDGNTSGSSMQPIYTTAEAEGFTQQEIDELIAEIESDDYDIMENSTMFLRRRGSAS
jgi:hypothetical protein